MRTFHHLGLHVYLEIQIMLCRINASGLNCYLAEKGIWELCCDRLGSAKLGILRKFKKKIVYKTLDEGNPSVSEVIVQCS